MFIDLTPAEPRHSECAELFIYLLIFLFIVTERFGLRGFVLFHCQTSSLKQQRRLQTNIIFTYTHIFSLYIKKQSQNSAFGANLVI